MWVEQGGWCQDGGVGIGSWEFRGYSLVAGGRWAELGVEMGGWNWVGGTGWGLILDGWGWVGMNGVGGGEWGWVHCLIIPIGNATSGYKRKVVVAPHRKAKQVRSNKQTLSEIANRLKALAENSRKYNKMMIEEERKLEERYLSFQREEVEKNR